MAVEIFWSPFRHLSYAIVTTDEQLAEFKKEHEIDYYPDFKFIEDGAQVHHFDREEGPPMAVLLMKKRNDKPDTEIYALLAHESVHIWQRICELMEEDAPSREFEAYSIQRILIDLLGEWAKGDDNE